MESSVEEGKEEGKTGRNEEVGEGESTGGEGKVLRKMAVPYVNHRGIKFTQRRSGE